VVEHMLNWYAEEGRDGVEVAGVWMTSDESTEEKNDEQRVRNLAKARKINFQVWKDEKYFIDEYVPNLFSKCAP
jgi:deoxyribodipyrimidine photo-lyase